MQPRQMYTTCTDALGEFVRNAGFDDVLIGLSGGIDSSLVCAMACDALQSSHVHGLIMPGPYSSDSSVEDAEKLAGNLGVAASMASICEPFEAFERVLASACGGKLSGTAAENTQARCRMTCLMAISNAQSWLVINTGNKSEAMMGYSTLYGDTAGAFAPLGGIYKSDVYACARWRNEQAESRGEIAPIPQSVLEKAPSAELSAGQRDETSLGLPYDKLDEVLIAAFEHNMDVDAIAEATGIEATQVADIIERAQSFAYKRAAEPPAPKAKFYE